MNDAVTKFSASASHIAMVGRPFGAPRIHMDETAAGGAPATFDSPSDAATHWVTVRNKAPEAPAAAETPAADAGAADPAAASDGDPQLSDEGNAAPVDPAHGGDDGSDPEPPAAPPIARPKSWANDDQAEWDGLPRSLQEKIAARETTREKAIRQSQNDAAEKLKGLTAKEQAAEQARTQYEAQAKQALAILEREQLRDFPDIRTPADVANLAATDPLRFNLWQAHQTQIAWAADQAKQADDRATKAKTDEWNTFRSAENAKAVEHIPELGDAKQANVVMGKAVKLLQDVGFSAEELGKYDGGEKLSLFDHRVQRILFDAIRYQDLQAAKAAVKAKPVPPVQRPGTQKPQGQAQSERIQALTNRFNNSGSLEDAVALRQAQRSAARR